MDRLLITAAEDALTVDLHEREAQPTGRVALLLLAVAPTGHSGIVRFTVPPHALRSSFDVVMSGALLDAVDELLAQLGQMGT